MTPLDRFRAAVMADPAARSALAAITDPQAFAAQALDWAEAHGIALPEGDLAAPRRRCL